MKRSRKVSARIILLAIMASIFMTLFQNCGGSVTLQSAPKPPPTLPPPETKSTLAVINVTSSTPDGIYNQGSVISIQVIFSEAVFVTGTPTLTLNTTPIKTATYVSGSGTASLTFSYTVGATEISADLDYSITTALSLNGGTIQNSKEKAAELTLASPGVVSSLGANKDIVIQLQQLCVPNSTSSSGCPTISNGSSVKTCNAQGSAYGLCASSCSIGYTPSGTQPNITCSLTQVCAPNSTTSTGCPTITNGSSLKTCNAQGTAYGSCTSSCSTGYTLSGTQPNITCSENASSASLAAGFKHSCAIVNGGVKCWGVNWSGQLGDGSTIGSRVPVNVQGLTSGVKAITAAGVEHTCAITTGGGVKCWGMNWSGQLGDGTTTYSLVPVDVQGLTSGVKAIAGGYTHTCAVTTSGGVKCWGANWAGQLGDNSTIDSLVPVDVQGLTSGVIAITAGWYHSCAVMTSGAAKCWGFNRDGELGDNSTTNKSVPVNVQGLTTGVTAITAGDFYTCAITTSGAAKCWGLNNTGQLGDNSSTNKSVPVNVQGLTSGVTAIAGGCNHTCAITTGSAVKCWGQNNFGQLGDNSSTNKSTPVNVQGLTSGVKAISTGLYQSCAITTNDAVKCWGGNDSGQLGNNSTTDSRVPVSVIGIP